MVLRVKHLLVQVLYFSFIRYEEGMVKAEESPSAAASVLDSWAEAEPKDDPLHEATDILVSR